MGEAMTAGSGRRGDAAAYARLYRERNGQLVAYATSLTGSRQVAEDLVAEAHFRVWRRLAAGHDVKDVPACLTAIVRNLAAGAGRARRDAVRDGWDSAADTAPDAKRRTSQVDLLTRLLKELPDRWATALWYAEVEDLPVEGVGARIGRSESAASVALARGRERLREAYLSGQPGKAANDACAEPWKLLPSVITGAASARRTRRVAEHTGTCAQCRKRLAALTEADSRLPLILGPALLVGMLDDALPAETAVRSGSRATGKHARVKTAIAATGTGSGASATTLFAAKGVLVGSVAVAGVAAAATAFAFGVFGTRHEAAAAVAPVSEGTAAFPLTTASASAGGLTVTAAASTGPVRPTTVTAPGTGTAGPGAPGTRAAAVQTALTATSAQAAVAASQASRQAQQSTSPASSPTPSPAQSVTQSPTQTPTQGAPTTTGSQSPTGSVSPTPTQTPTGTPTQTPTGSTAPTQTPTGTATNTPTSSATDAPTSSATDATSLASTSTSTSSSAPTSSTVTPALSASASSAGTAASQTNPTGPAVSATATTPAPAGS